MHQGLGLGLSKGQRPVTLRPRSVRPLALFRITPWPEARNPSPVRYNRQARRRLWRSAIGSRSRVRAIAHEFVCLPASSSRAALMRTTKSRDF